MFTVAELDKYNKFEIRLYVICKLTLLRGDSWYIIEIKDICKNTNVPK